MVILTPGLNFINIQHTVSTLIDHKSVKRYWLLDWVVTFWGATCVKAACRLLMILTPGLPYPKKISTFFPQMYIVFFPNVHYLDQWYLYLFEKNSTTVWLLPGWEPLYVVFYVILVYKKNLMSCWMQSLPQPCQEYLNPVLSTVMGCQILNFESYQHLGKNILGPLKLTCASGFYCTTIIKKSFNKRWRENKFLYDLIQNSGSWTNILYFLTFSRCLCLSDFQSLSQNL